jgi:TM2 domain-containing membrane protein YozV
MNARTFGKKNAVGGGGDAIASRRAAFVADERARAERVAESEVFEAPAAAVRAKAAEVVAELETAPPVILNRSLKVAYALWLGLGVFGAHRFYLARPLTAAILATLFIASFVMVAREHYPYFAGIAVAVMWMVGDGFLIEPMHRKLTGGAFAK